MNAASPEGRRIEARLRDRYTEVWTDIRRELDKHSEQRYSDLVQGAGDPEDAATADVLIDLNLTEIDHDAQELDEGLAPSYAAAQGVVVEKAKALAEKLGLDGDDTVVDALVDLVRSSLPPPPEPDLTGTATASLVESMILAQQRQELGRTLPSLADDDDAWESVLDRTQSLLRTGDYGADYASAFQDAAALTFGDRWYEARRSEGSRRSSQRINGSLEVQSVSNRESEGKPLTLEQRSDRMLMALLARDDGELDEASTQAELARLYRPAY